VRAAEPPRVLIAGGGVAALEAVLALQEIAGRRFDLVLLSAGPYFEYGPLSVAEPFNLGRAHRFELREILADRGVEITIDSLEAVDPGNREARTASGVALRYDALLVAIGARKHSGLPGAITFSGARATADVRSLLQDAEAGTVERIAFAVPKGITWSLPIYELALMTSAHFAERDIPTAVSLVTPEPRPVDVFGGRATGAVEEMMRLRGIAFHSAVPVRAEPGRLIVEGGEPVPADAVVALPRLDAPRIAGLPTDEDGFVPIDRYGRVRDLEGVYAAGDVTSFPLKQGGLASQQADAAAEAIAADLGENVDPHPFRPVLRGLLLTGRAPRYLRAEVMRGLSTQSTVGSEAVWWPPAKIAGRRLGPLLALHGAPGGAPPGAVALELDASEPPGDGRIRGRPAGTDSSDPRRGGRR
jgi:sulfide:quinone oxidoreductase